MELREIAGDEMTLLAEFNHRLFNTLQIIASAIAQCRRDLCDRGDMTSLAELEARLKALGRMHQLLSRPAPDFQLENHCRCLCILLVQAFGREDVTPWVVMDDVNFSPMQAFSVPLMVIELVTNVLKHSLADQADSMVWVDLRARGDQIELTVTDNRKVPIPLCAPSSIVSALARKLHGEAFAHHGHGWVAGARIPHKPDMTATAA